MLHKRILIIAGPSGSGKTTVTKALMSRYPQLSFSVSATTRTMRSGEENGKDYYFLSTDEFNKKIKDDEFVEYEEVYSGMFYGTLKAEIKRIWDATLTPVLDVDVLGAVHIKQIYGDIAMTIFINPPEMKALAERLRSRGTETEETIAKRLERVRIELAYAEKFDYVIDNIVLEEAVSNADKILRENLFA